MRFLCESDLRIFCLKEEMEISAFRLIKKTVFYTFFNQIKVSRITVYGHLKLRPINLFEYIILLDFLKVLHVHFL